MVTTGLAQNRTLVTLELGSNRLTDTAARYLREVLTVNRRLEGLSLWDNSISGEVWCQMKCSQVLQAKLPSFATSGNAAASRRSGTERHSALAGSR